MALRQVRRLVYYDARRRLNAVQPSRAGRQIKSQRSLDIEGGCLAPEKKRNFFRRGVFHRKAPKVGVRPSAIINFLVRRYAMRTCKILGVFVSLLAVFILSSCGGGGSTPLTSGQQMGSVFTMGTDNPPLPSVLSVQVQITSVTLSDDTTTVTLLNGPQTVDFAKLNGLRSLLDLNDVPAGSYNSATIMVGGATIGFLDTTQTPPVLNTITANVAPMTVTVPLAQPLVLADQDLVGFFMDLDLRQSIGTDMNGNITGNFKPTLDVKAISADDANAFIDDFYAGVVSVNPAGNQFVIQGPH